MVANTRECGETIKWKARVSFSGPMVANMKATTSTIKKRDMGHSIGLTDESMRVTGRMASSMAWESTRQHQERQRRANGKMVNAHHGSERVKMTTRKA